MEQGEDEPADRDSEVEDEDSEESSEEDDDRAVDRILYIRRATKSEENETDKLDSESKEEEAAKDRSKEKSKPKEKKGGNKKEGFGDAIEILVKWKDQSYIHCSWIDEPTVFRLARIKYLNYLRSLVWFPDVCIMIDMLTVAFSGKMEEPGPIWDTDLDELIEAQEDGDSMYENGLKLAWTTIDRIIKSKYVVVLLSSDFWF